MRDKGPILLYFARGYPSVPSSAEKNIFSPLNVLRTTGEIAFAFLTVLSED